MKVLQKPQKETLGCPLEMNKNKQRTRKSSRKPRMQTPRKNLLTYQPKNLHIKFPWVWKGSITEGAAGLGADQVYRANSLFDPDFTGVGDQPMGFDQWSALFGVFRVEGCRYSITFTNANTSPCLVGVLPSTNAGLSSQSTSWMSARGARSATLGAITGGRNVVNFSGSIRPWALQDTTKQQYMDDPNSAGTPAGNPGRVVYLHVFCIGFGTVASVNILTKLWFDSQLWARNEFNQS